MTTRTITVRHRKNDATAEYLDKVTLAVPKLKKRAADLFWLTLSGIQKDPEQRTAEEKEILSEVFEGLRLANERAEARQKGNKPKKKPLVFSFPSAERPFLSYQAIDAIFKNLGDPYYYALPAQVNQQAVRDVCTDAKTFFRALKAWKEQPEKFRRKPRVPKYGGKKRGRAVFTNQVAKLRTDGDMAYIFFPKKTGEIPVGDPSLYGGRYIRMEAAYDGGGYKLSIIMEQDTEEPAVPDKPERVWGCDMGVGNFLACANNYGGTPFIISGGWLKSENRRFNRERARLMSDLNRGRGQGESEGGTRRMQANSRKREDRFRDFFYKSAHYMCRRARAEGVGAIVVGHMGKAACLTTGGKERKRINQNFASIPYAKFEQILGCVAAKYGLPVIVREESYTSQASAIDKDPVPTCRKGGTGTPRFSGTRVKRGLYRTKDGTLLNADVNGAANTARKEYPEAFADADLSFLAMSVDVIRYWDLYPAKGRDKEPRKRAKENERHKMRKRKRAELSAAFAGRKPGEAAGRTGEQATEGEG